MVIYLSMYRRFGIHIYCAIPWKQQCRRLGSAAANAPTKGSSNVALRALPKYKYTEMPYEEHCKYNMLLDVWKMRSTTSGKRIHKYAGQKMLKHMMDEHQLKEGAFLSRKYSMLKQGYEIPPLGYTSIQPYSLIEMEWQSLKLKNVAPKYLEEAEPREIQINIYMNANTSTLSTELHLAYAYLKAKWTVKWCVIMTEPWTGDEAKFWTAFENIPHLWPKVLIRAMPHGTQISLQPHFDGKRKYFWAMSLNPELEKVFKDTKNEGLTEEPLPPLYPSTSTVDKDVDDLPLPAKTDETAFWELKRTGKQSNNVESSSPGLNKLDQDQDMEEVDDDLALDRLIWELRTEHMEERYEDMDLKKSTVENGHSKGQKQQLDKNISSDDLSHFKLHRQTALESKSPSGHPIHSEISLSSDSKAQGLLQKYSAGVRETSPSYRLLTRRTLTGSLGNVSTILPNVTGEEAYKARMERMKVAATIRESHFNEEQLKAQAIEIDRAKLALAEEIKKERGATGSQRRKAASQERLAHDQLAQVVEKRRSKKMWREKMKKLIKKQEKEVAVRKSLPSNSPIPRPHTSPELERGVPRMANFWSAPKSALGNLPLNDSKAEKEVTNLVEDGKEFMTFKKEINEKELSAESLARNDDMSSKRKPGRISKGKEKKRKDLGQLRKQMKAQSNTLQKLFRGEVDDDFL